MSAAETSPIFIVVDLFCGAGGTSLGFHRSTLNGRPLAVVAACVNHDPLALRSHKRNFPNCVHFQEDVRNMDLKALSEIVEKYREMYPSAKVVLWASLECTHFSNAKTGSRDADSRTLAWVLYDYEKALRPDIIQIENVREFMSWGPLVAKVVKAKGEIGDHCTLAYDKKSNRLNGVFIPESRKKGRDYLKWKQGFEQLGYRYDYRLLDSADYGSYQARLRYFGLFVKNRTPIYFPPPTHDKQARNGLPKHKAVRDVLDLHEIGDSIFARKKPLSPNTMKRILAGLIKFATKREPQYIVKAYGGNHADKVAPIDRSAGTITTIPHESIVTPVFITQYNGRPNNSVFDSDRPCNTVTTNDRFGIVQVFIDNAFGCNGESRGATTVDKPIGTLTTVPKKNVVTVQFLDRQFGNSKCADINEPCGALATEPKTNIVQAEFIMPTNYSNEPGSLDSPAKTLTSNRKWHYVVSSETEATTLSGDNQYLLNPQYKNFGASIEKPCFTLIAKMDKRPPSIVSLDIEDGNRVVFVSPEYFKDESISPEQRIRVFMQAHGIRDIYMRMLNIPELMRIQGLNKAGQPEYFLQGAKHVQKKHIGNAVEPNVIQQWTEGFAAEIINGRSGIKFTERSLFNQE